jgi:hypothetical protein
MLPSTLRGHAGIGFRCSIADLWWHLGRRCIYLAKFPSDLFKKMTACESILPLPYADLAWACHFADQMTAMIDPRRRVSKDGHDQGRDELSNVARCS